MPPQNVIGSLGKTSVQIVDGKPEVMKDAGIAFIDEKDGKPVGIRNRPTLTAL